MDTDALAECGSRGGVGSFNTIGGSGISKVSSEGCKARVVSVVFIPLLCFVVLLLRADADADD